MKGTQTPERLEEEGCEAQAGKGNEKTLLARSMSYMYRYWPTIAVTFVITVVVSALSIARPWIQKLLIDNVTLGGSTKKLLEVVILLLAVALLQVICRIAQRYFFARVQQGTAQDLRKTISDWLFSLKMRDASGKDTGGIISTVLQDVEKMSDLYGPVVVGLASDALQFVAIIVIMIYLDITLTALVIPLYILMMLSMKDATKPIQKASNMVQEAKAKVSSSVKEFWSSLAETKTLNGKDYIMKILHNAFDRLRSSEIRMETIQALFQSVDLFVWLIAAAMLWVGGRKVIDGAMTMGDLIAYWGYMALILGPINNFINSLGIGRASLGAAERVFALLDNGEPETFDQKGQLPFPVDYQQCIFRNVVFRYTENEELLSAFSCTIKRGEKIALIGRSGSGKTTIASLLTHLYAPLSGDICFDGIPLRSIALESLRKHTGLVFQASHVYSGTILDNISIAKPEATFSEVMEASEKAGILDFILSLKDGYNTRIGDGGRELSGGQRQRIALARLFLKRPSIVILDESTSALDSELEKLVTANILKEFNDSTVVVISHRESMINAFDRVIRL